MIARAWLWPGAVLLLAATPAFASGVEHVVDDAAVETPGTCHVENWVSLLRRGDGLAVSAPACTPRALPNFELGGFISRGWSRQGVDHQIGLTPKWKWRDEQRGIGLGLSGSAAIDPASGKLAGASLIVPVTIPAGRRWRFNLNAGWEWASGQVGHHAFAGGQVELQLTPRLGLMAEGFTRDRGPAGMQIGLRWTPQGGRVDFDLAYGRHVESTSRDAVTLGLTARFF